MSYAVGIEKGITGDYGDSRITVDYRWITRWVDYGDSSFNHRDYGVMSLIAVFARLTPRDAARSRQAPP